MAKNSIKVNQKHYTTKGKFLGIFLTFICGCAFLTTCTLVKIYNLNPAEVCFIRGIVQLTVFLLLYIVERQRRQPKLSYEADGNNLSKFRVEHKWLYFKAIFVVSLCGLSFGLMTALSYIGIKLIPISHFVVFGHTTPIFTLGFSALILRYSFQSILSN